MTPTEEGVRAVVLDIEGTTGSLSHVRDVLFPYARARLARWLAAHEDTADARAILTATRAHHGDPALTTAQAAAVLERWADEDRKIAPLKSLQALIWAAGYRDGELNSHVYPEVPTALRQWRSLGIARYVYSSGTETAQRDWFAYAGAGDLPGLLDGHFDLTSGGAKDDPGSYRAIAAAVGEAAHRILFFSDEQRELDAAARAGWRVLAVRRPGDPRGHTVPGHRCVGSLDEAALRALSKYPSRSSPDISQEKHSTKNSPTAEVVRSRRD